MTLKPGPTGKFPKGKLNEFDEGELAVAVSNEKGMVRIDFNKKISWIALEPHQAMAFAKNLMYRAIGLTGGDIGRLKGGQEKDQE